MSMTDNYIETIRTDADMRARLVESMRSAAERLKGNEPPCDERTRIAVAYRIAEDLLYAASRICDHARLRPDGRCRFCDAIVVEAR